MTDFATWWYTEGSATPIPGNDGEEHLKRMCQIAWSNGAEVERVSMTQLFTDPENQPTQHGTVTVEYMQREIAAEREACARICETEWSTTQEHVHGLALADMIRDRAKP